MSTDAAIVLLVVLAGAIVYSLLSMVAAFRYLSVRPPALTAPEPISILKPLSGLDLDLESNLRTFFEQDYPSFEILFAVKDTSDPAAEVVERLRREYPRVSSQLLLTGESPYPNAKVFSLDRMLAIAANDLLVMSDSDIRVTPDLLRTAAAEFQEKGLGIATCPYRAVAGPSFWSRLEATGMNTDFMAGILVARMLAGMQFAVGPTIVARKKVLASIGGFDRFKGLPRGRFCDGKVCRRSWTGRDSFFLRDRTSHRQCRLARKYGAPSALDSQHAAFASFGIHRPVVHHAGAACVAGLHRASSVVAGASADAVGAWPGSLCCFRAGVESETELVAAADGRFDGLRLLDCRILRQHHHLAGTALSSSRRWAIRIDFRKQSVTAGHPSM